MSSTDSINFSVRQNKAIERSLAFEGLQQLMAAMAEGTEYLYVGLGSIWFVDFDMAHRLLGIDSMISVESDAITHRRANYNKPYGSIEVVPGDSDDVLPELIKTRPELSEKPWILWLDYDKHLDERKLREFDDLIRTLPPNSVLLTTFNAKAGSYARRPADRREAFIDLLGDAFPNERFPSNNAFKDDQMIMDALADAVLDRLGSRTNHFARPGGFVPGFKLKYADNAPMVTVGGCFPSEERSGHVRDLVASDDWPCFLDDAILTPPLTLREAHALKALLPRQASPTRTDVQELGFDLSEESIESFVRHYKHYPMFVQAVR